VSESFKQQIVQRIGRNLTDIMILRLIRTQPTWGYKITKTMETSFNVKLGHGVLYPLLNSLEKSGFLQSRRERHGGRIRKIYEITAKGIQLIDAYHEFLKEQAEMQDMKRTEENE
jgi:DNA-binding PadR family transcriptional regulator